MLKWAAKRRRAESGEKRSQAAFLAGNPPPYQKGSKSLSENCEGCCGGGFWLGARRSGRSIPAAGCDARDNEAPRQKIRRPKGFRAKSSLASWLLGRRPIKGMGFPSPANWFPEAESCANAQGSLPRRASPASLLPENSTPRNFKTDSNGISTTGRFAGDLAAPCHFNFCVYSVSIFSKKSP